MSSSLTELRIACRQLRSAPTTGLSVIAVLALGLAAALLVSAAAEALLLRPLPYPRPHRLVTVRASTRGGDLGGVSLLDFQDLRRQTETLVSLAAYRRRSFLLHTEGDAGVSRVVQTAQSTAGLPATLGVPPIAGRDFSAGEERDGAKVTLLTGDVAERLFTDLRSAVGESVLLNDVSYEIVGVLPRSFELWVDGQVVDAVVPLDPGLYGTSRGVRSLTVVARLADGASLSTATQELHAIAGRLAAAHPDTNAGNGLEPTSLQEFLRGDNRAPLTLLSLAAGLLLLAATLNAGSLLLERTLGRAREIGVRLSLGAGGRRLARQFLLEAGVLVSLGLTLGAGLAAVGLRLLPRLLQILGGAPEILAMHALAPRPNLATGGVAAALALIVAAALGLGITAIVRRLDPLALMRFGPDTAGGGRVRRGLVATQVGLSMALALAASLLTFAFADLVSTDPGFRVDDVLRFGIGIPEARYRTEEAQIRFHRRLEERLRQIPGVDAAGIVADLPAGGVGFGTWYLPAGRELPREERPATGINVVSPAALEALEIPLLRGRRFSADDAPGAPRVALVDATLAAEWASGDPLGARIRIGWRSELHPTGSEWEIVGVVGAVRQRGLAEPPGPMLYLSAGQFPLDGGNYVVRTRDGTTLAAGVLADAVNDVDPGLVRVRAAPLADRVAASVGGERTAMAVSGGFAGLALALTCVGVYGLVAVDAVRRRRETAIRQALGATPARVTRLLLASGMRTAVSGMVLGVLLSVPAVGLLRGRLHHLPAAGPLPILAALAAILAVCLPASLLPARRGVARAPARFIADD